MKIRHYFADFSGLGGVNRMLREHYDRDAKWLGDSEFVIYTESNDRDDPRLHFLGMQGWKTIAEGRKRVRKLVEQNPVDFAIFHGNWGYLNLGDLETAPRRIRILHGSGPGALQWLKSHGHEVDGLGCVSEPLYQTVTGPDTGMEPERALRIPYPVDDPVSPAVPDRPLASPIVIGVCGRIVREQKRVERIPAFCKRLNQSGITYRLEFLGDGPDREWLTRELQDLTEVTFHGNLSGSAYWDTLAKWDLIAFFSDYEGLPIAMLEALSCGAIPVFPRIGCGGDDYAGRIHPELVYPAANPEAAAERVIQLLGKSAPEIADLRKRCLDLTHPHNYDEYFSRMKRFTEEICQLPPRNEQSRQRRSGWFDHVPLKLLHRTVGLRHLWWRLTSGEQGAPATDIPTGIVFR